MCRFAANIEQLEQIIEITHRSNIYLRIKTHPATENARYPSLRGVRDMKFGSFRMFANYSKRKISILFAMLFKPWEHKRRMPSTRLTSPSAKLPCIIINIPPYLMVRGHPLKSAAFIVILSLSSLADANGDRHSSDDIPRSGRRGEQGVGMLQRLQAPLLESARKNTKKWI